MADDTDLDEPETNDNAPLPTLPPEGASISEIIDFFYDQSYPEGFPKYGFYDYLQQLMTYGFVHAKDAGRDGEKKKEINRDLEQFFRKLWNYLLKACKGTIDKFSELFEALLEPLTKIGCADPLSKIIADIVAFFKSLTSGIDPIPLEGGSRNDTLAYPAISWTCTETWLTVVVDGIDVIYSAEATTATRSADVEFVMVDEKGNEVTITRTVTQGDALDDILGWINDIFDKIKLMSKTTEEDNYFDKTLELFLNKMKELWDYIADFFNQFAELIKNSWGTMQSFVDGLSRDVREAARAILNQIEQAIISLLQPFIDIVKAFLDLFESSESYWYLYSTDGMIPADMSDTVLITPGGDNLNIGTPVRSDDPNYNYLFTGDGFTALYSYSPDALKIQVVVEGGDMYSASLQVKDEETTESGIYMVTWCPDPTAEILDTIEKLVEKIQSLDLGKIVDIPKKIFQFVKGAADKASFEILEVAVKVIINILFYAFWLTMEIIAGSKEGVATVPNLFNTVTDLVDRLAAYA